MSPATSRQAAPTKEQVELIRSAIETSIGGMLEIMFKKQTYLKIELFPKGIDLIDVEAKVGLPNAPLVELHVKIAGPGSHAAAPEGQ
ncbi:hypothetical protein ACVIWV_000441 [Bradyrhizobium diazoefficiens]|uniref:hypothetical protein n=1 Tax=Bradyrhizobium TaxID=374 RepID=UPI000ACA3605|nr:hypothetical protein [Bradyrhizobium diazoefficiens]MBR0867684.1 hypothetical protein [Bradyrhizobium diazoefficiens]MBR0892384.1 hypothetical protein [Bradyrhizobium diazoefficiens]MBR0924065.1 hypothetical protein [Bradyrhizobium diazoefficiens]